MIQRLSFVVWRRTISICFRTTNKLTFFGRKFKFHWRCTLKHLKKISFSFALQMKRQWTFSYRPSAIIALRHRIVRCYGKGREVTNSCSTLFITSSDLQRWPFPSALLRVLIRGKKLTDFYSFFSSIYFFGNEKNTLKINTLGLVSTRRIINNDSRYAEYLREKEWMKKMHWLALLAALLYLSLLHFGWHSLFETNKDNWKLRQVFIRA